MSQPASAYFGNPVDQNTHPTNGSHSSGTHPAATDNRPSSSRNKLASFALSRVKPPSKLDDAGPGSETHSTASQPRTAEQRKRHEEWQRRLEAPGGLIRRRRSLALDEAAAAEIRRASGLDVDTPDPAIDAETRTVETPIEVDSDSERHKKSNDLAAKFASQFAAAEPTKGGRKGKGKKKEEVGPSGQTYTPLEKQFLEIKGEHPDVLLLMEGGFPPLTLRIYIDPLCKWDTSTSELFCFDSKYHTDSVGSMATMQRSVLSLVEGHTDKPQIASKELGIAA